MLKAGIFLDSDNLSYNGGWGMQFDVVKELVKAQGAVVLRANAYMAVDRKREAHDDAYRAKKHDYRDAIRRNGFHLVLKEVKRYYDEEEDQVVLKANADLDLAVDALLQSENLDYILLGSGDGDFLRLVRALQNKGKRVDTLAFDNVNSELRMEADHFFSGALIPGLLPNLEAGPERYRGVMNRMAENRDYAFLSVRTGLGVDDMRHDVFLHINDLNHNGYSVNNYRFAEMYREKSILEFDLVMQNEGRFAGRLKAENASEFAA